MMAKRPRDEPEADGAAVSSAPLPPCSSLPPAFAALAWDEVDVIALLERLHKVKSLISSSSFARLPPTPLPAWQRVALSALEHVRHHRVSEQEAQRRGKKLSRELRQYRHDAKAREARLRLQQRLSRARLGSRLAVAAARYWARRGDVYSQLMRLEFDMAKRRRDRRRQDDLLRETEELTRRLLDNLVNRGVGATEGDEKQQRGGRQSDTPVAAHEDKEIIPVHSSSSSLSSSSLSGVCADVGADTAAAAQATDPCTGRAHDETLLPQPDAVPDAWESKLTLLNTEQGRRPLRDYQRSSLHWMVHLYECKLNGILADEMGLGKTVQTIALLCYYAEYKNDWGPHLIVVPTTVVLNWVDELRRWAPGLKTMAYMGSAKARQRLRVGWASEDALHVCVTSYNLVVHDRAVFRRRPWGFLVLDEAHQVKNFMSKKWQSLFDLQAEHRLLLTGTPLQNSVMELWSLFHFLLPFASAFRSHEEFKEWFSNPMDEMVTGRTALNADVVRRLQALLRPFMLRRLKKDVESQLPTKTEKVVLCPLSRRQRALYDDYMQLAETRQRLAGGRGAGGVLSVLLALRKVCNHPDMFAERPVHTPLVLDRGWGGVTTPVPRQLLMRGNRDRRRWRFPQLVHVCDCNADAMDEYNDDAAAGAATNGCAREERSRLLDIFYDDEFPLWWRLRCVFVVDARAHTTLRTEQSKGRWGKLCGAANEEERDEKKSEQAHDATMATIRSAGQPSATQSSAAMLTRLLVRAAQQRRCQLPHARRTGAAELLLPGPVRWYMDNDEYASRANWSMWWNAEPQMTTAARARACVPRHGAPVDTHSTNPSVSSGLPMVVRDVYTRVPRRCGGYAVLPHALCPTASARVTCMLPLLQHVAFYVPRVCAAHAPRLHCRTRLHNRAAFVQPSGEDVAADVARVARRMWPAGTSHLPGGSWLARGVYDASFFARELWPLQIRRCFGFPDRRLIIHDCGKLQFLATALKQLRAAGHRMLIFTQFVHMLDILERFLALVAVSYLRLDGATRAECRQQMVDYFNAETRVTCMILSTRSGGIGLNLIGADTVIFYDSDWNPTMDLQAQDRCHRIGQTRPVTIYRLVSEHTVEESILQKARERKKLNNVVIRGGQFNVIANVGELYEDSSAAFVALSNPVNLRSFFHDLDEDATVVVPSPAAVDDTASHLLSTMESLEDEEDREARRRVEAEMQQREAEAREDGSESDSGGPVTASPTAVHPSSVRRVDQPSSAPALTRAARFREALVRRQREVLASRTHTALDRLMALRYAYTREGDARRRYAALRESYAAHLRSPASSSSSCSRNRSPSASSAENEERAPRFRKRVACDEGDL